MNVYCTQRHAQVARLAAQFPDVCAGRWITWVSSNPSTRRPPPMAGPSCPNLLALAEFENVSVKISGAGTLSREAFPFARISASPCDRILDSFGVERCMWGTDWTRAVELLSYEDGVEAFRQGDWVSDGDRAALMGQQATSIRSRSKYRLPSPVTAKLAV